MKAAAIWILLFSGFAAAAAVPAMKEPLGFEHVAHQGYAAGAGLACTFCHPAGPGTTPDRSRCHDCHQHLVKEAPRSAPAACTTCHQAGADLAPASHGPGWDQQHGSESFGRKAACKSCHEAAACLDCHERRGAMAANPHGPAWRSLHGIEARRDPESCAGCHAAVTCTTCHETGRWPW